MPSDSIKMMPPHAKTTPGVRQSLLFMFVLV
jgi:hypothetical protein